MYPTKTGAKSAHSIALLLGSVSFLALTSASAFAQDPAPAAESEEVLITGSLIRGAPAIGVPVTAVGEEQFQ